MPKSDEIISKLKEIKALINKNIVYYFLCIIILTGAGYGYYILGKFNELSDKQKVIDGVQAELPNLEQQANAVTQQGAVPQPQVVHPTVPVVIYSSPYLSLDLQSAGFELVDQLVQMFQATGNKIDEISFTNQPVQGNVGILSVNLTLNTSYINLEKILAKIYTWKYLAGIKSIDLEPDKDNSNILSTKLTIDLYVKKDS